MSVLVMGPGTRVRVKRTDDPYTLPYSGCLATVLWSGPCFFTEWAAIGVARVQIDGSEAEVTLPVEDLEILL